MIKKFTPALLAGLAIPAALVAAPAAAQVNGIATVEPALVIAQSQALHILGVVSRRFQGHQRPFAGSHRMAQGFGHGIAIAGRTGGGITEAAGGQDDPAGGDGLTFRPDAGNNAVFR